ncbi:putative alpha amylase, catalytic domain subfamily [Cadophora sp. MPI-SDFR-AT-0126]|nr:putative alpha amylase, catalytic domain subfamily [Leotiomycetes sp. MPI-SDFR-AT-0126]
MSYDLLERRKSKFVLWIPSQPENPRPPQLVLGTFNPSPPATVATFNQAFHGPLTSSIKDLWELDPNDIQPALTDGTYYYWFEIQDTSPQNLGIVQVTDPIAYNVDYRVWRLTGDKKQPASVIKFRDGKLWPCDRDGHEPGQVTIPSPETIPDNNHLVIYELPTSWARYSKVGDVEMDTGTFTDVLALFDSDVSGDQFRSVSAVSTQAILANLGVNALELLPAADARPTGEWGYATANYFATDFDLGTATSLVKLVDKIHEKKVRLFTDVVMAFGHDPYVYIAYDQFHIDPRSPAEFGNDERWQSHTPHTDDSQLRDGYGGRSWRYVRTTNTYDPESGTVKDVHPSWAFHKAHVHRWMSDFGVGGLRLDSVNNIANYDFVRSYKEHAMAVYQSKHSSPPSSKFLVIGEELSCPLDLIQTGSLNALWNEPFQARIRAAILGESVDHDFESTVRKMIDCRGDPNHPFWDGAQAVNYITSHDTEGFRKERLYNFLSSNRVFDMERRAKFAHALLLTAVGIPMIFAGEEFLDQHDRDISGKQIDPVNYERKSEDWRSRIFDYVSTLVKLRKSCPALGDNDTDFFHVDSSRGGKIMAWKRGKPGHEPVVVVANFTDHDTPGGEYFVPNWPERDRGDWREVTQGRSVPVEWVGREPLMHWEVKIYTYWKEV